MATTSPTHASKELLKVAGRCNVRELKQMLGDGADSGVVGFSGFTPMHRAAGSTLPPASDDDRVACLILLRQAGANPDAKTERGITPLHCATSPKSTAAIFTLHDMGVDLDAKDEEGRSPSALCMQYRNGKGALALRSLGAAVMDNSYGALTMRQAAVMGGYTARLNTLLDRFPPERPGDDLESLSEFAQEHGMQDCLALIQSRMAHRMIAQIQNKAAMDPTPDWRVWTRDALDSSARAFHRDRLQEHAEIEYKSRDKLIEMKIDDFLALCKEGRSEGKLCDARSVIRQGESLHDIPYLHIARSEQSLNELIVDGHEGRHRAMALAEMGFKTMPVILRAAHIRWSEQNDPQRWDYLEQWPASIAAEPGARDEQFRIPMPVSREQAKQPYVLDHLWPAPADEVRHQLKKGMQP